MTITHPLKSAHHNFTLSNLIPGRISTVSLLSSVPCTFLCLSGLQSALATVKDSQKQGFNFLLIPAYWKKRLE